MKLKPLNVDLYNNTDALIGKFITMAANPYNNDYLIWKVTTKCIYGVNFLHSDTRINKSDIITNEKDFNEAAQKMLPYWGIFNEPHDITRWTNSEIDSAAKARGVDRTKINYKVDAYYDTNSAGSTGPNIDPELLLTQAIRHLYRTKHINIQLDKIEPFGKEDLKITLKDNKTYKKFSFFMYRHLLYKNYQWDDDIGIDAKNLTDIQKYIVRVAHCVYSAFCKFIKSNFDVDDMAEAWKKYYEL